MFLMVKNEQIFDKNATFLQGWFPAAGNGKKCTGRRRVHRKTQKMEIFFYFSIF